MIIDWVFSSLFEDSSGELAGHSSAEETAPLGTGTCCACQNPCTDWCWCAILHQLEGEVTSAGMACCACSAVTEPPHLLRELSRPSLPSAASCRAPLLMICDGQPVGVRGLAPDHCHSRQPSHRWSPSSRAMPQHTCHLT